LTNENSQQLTFNTSDDNILNNNDSARLKNEVVDRVTKKESEYFLMRQNAIEMIDVSQMKLTQQDCRPKQQVVNRNINHGVSKTVLGIRTTSLPPPQPKP